MSRDTATRSTIEYHEDLSDESSAGEEQPVALGRISTCRTTMMHDWGTALAALGAWTADPQVSFRPAIRFVLDGLYLSLGANPPRAENDTTMMTRLHLKPASLEVNGLG